MSEPDFPPHIRAALDRFAVPPLSAGFADRLIARVEAGDLPAAAHDALPPLPRARLQRVSGGRWRRSGFIAGSIGLFGMVTAAAAATGFFGEPVYVPVVSEALAKANIAPMPVRHQTAKSKPSTKSRPALAKTQPKEETAKPASTQGKDEARTLIRSLWQDPEFRALPRPERRIAARQRLQAAINAGTFTQSDMQDATQELRARRIERRAERKAARQARKAPTAAVRPLTGAAAPANDPASAEPNAPLRPRLLERLQSATPEERAQILERVRARRAARQAAQAADTPLQSEPTEPVAEPTK